jgi:Na+-transporting NADH:ubiquinone oxidoreductase subunit NqrB
MNDSDKRDAKPGLLTVIGSILAAGFGVQSSRNQQRDFSQGNARHFIIGGIIFTLLFMLTVYLVVSTVLESAGR